MPKVAAAGVAAAGGGEVSKVAEPSDCVRWHRRVLPSNASCLRLVRINERTARICFGSKTICSIIRKQVPDKKRTIFTLEPRKNQVSCFHITTVYFRVLMERGAERKHETIHGEFIEESIVY